MISKAKYFQQKTLNKTASEPESVPIVLVHLNQEKNELRDINLNCIELVLIKLVKLDFLKNKDKY